jgi:uncharacterized protein
MQENGLRAQAMVRAILCGFALLLASCTAANSGNGKVAGCNAGEARGTSEADLNQIELCIGSGKKILTYVVEVAETGPQQQKGLMFRTQLADNRGMLFPFRDPRIASFWMKNTVIPLDIIFIRADGKIENIVENTIPYSLDQVKSTGPVVAVLELRGGLTGELGISPGDTVRWK